MCVCVATCTSLLDYQSVSCRGWKGGGLWQLWEALADGCRSQLLCLLQKTKVSVCISRWHQSIRYRLKGLATQYCTYIRHAEWVTTPLSMHTYIYIHRPWSLCVYIGKAIDLLVSEHSRWNCGFCVFDSSLHVGVISLPTLILISLYPVINHSPA